MSIFEMTTSNVQFFKSPPSLDACLKEIGNQPYWNVKERVCYHVHEKPLYIIHNDVYVPSKYAHHYDDYFHVTNLKKPLYAISHYSNKELEDMCTRLRVSSGKKRDMYDKITLFLKKIDLD